jgi:hypothetical protein
MMRRSLFLIALVVAGGVGFAIAARSVPAPANPNPSSSPAAVPAMTRQTTVIEDVERRLGPFAVGPDTLPAHHLTVIERHKRVRGRPSNDPDAEALAVLEIVDASGTVHHRETFEYAIDRGAFASACSASVQLLKGNVASGLLLASGCLPSAPDAADTLQIFGAVKGRVQRFGKPFMVSGELVGLIHTPVTQAGRGRMIQPDLLRFKVRTPNFLVTTSVSVDWMQGRVSLGQRCYGQTGQGMREEGCEVPVEAERVPSDEDETFVRLFDEATEQAGLPKHVVVKKTSVVEFVAAKVRFVWDDAADIVDLHVDGDDTWLKLRIDGREGWIHTQEDFLAIGLPQSG